MTREERCKLAIERGYTYDPETGFIYSKLGKLVNCIDSHGYIVFGFRYEKKILQLKGHQFCWYWIYKKCVEEIDHINGNRMDNRISNLRGVTKQKNQWNRTTAKGYTWFKINNKWRSQIYLNSKKIHLGSFNTEEEARNAYLAAKEIYHKI